MNRRDKNIMSDLWKFRVLDRDQIIQLHFANNKDRVNSCNKVLKRLQRDGHITCDHSRRPFVYFPNPATVKKNSGKLPHFMSIADFVIEAKQLGQLKEYEVEVKLGKKGTVEPDLFMIWNKAPFFVEVQRSFYSPRQMKAKLERYEEYFDSGAWKELHWQRSNTKFFPYVLIVTDRPYALEEVPFKVIQVSSMNEFYEKYVPKKKETS
jgi:hypothetical protein